jgi:hypothetical protein
VGSGLIRVSIGVLVICALGAATAFLPSGAPRAVPRLQPSLELEASEGPAGRLGEQPAARAEWFQRQRAYPAGEIPPEALRRAARQTGSSSGPATAPPSLDWTSIGPSRSTSRTGYFVVGGPRHRGCPRRRRNRRVRRRRSGRRLEDNGRRRQLGACLRQRGRRRRNRAGDRLACGRSFQSEHGVRGNR